jgi:hypothetical protein
MCLVLFFGRFSFLTVWIALLRALVMFFALRVYIFVWLVLVIPLRSMVRLMAKLFWALLVRLLMLRFSFLPLRVVFLAMRMASGYARSGVGQFQWLERTGGDCFQ